MTRKDYKAIAAVIARSYRRSHAEAYTTAFGIAKGLCKEFMKSDQFDPMRFLVTCGFSEEGDTLSYHVQHLKEEREQGK